MREGSDGEVTLVYEADTPQYHRYKGVSKNGKKDITVYVERLGGMFTPIPRKVKAIINIDNRCEAVEKGRQFSLGFTVNPLFVIEGLAHQIAELIKEFKNARTSRRRKTTKAKSKKHNSNRT